MGSGIGDSGIGDRVHGDRAEWAMIGLLLALVLGQGAVAPAEYTVRLDTSKGPIVIAVHRDWAPHGADGSTSWWRRGYYDDARVLPDPERRVGAVRDRRGSEAGPGVADKTIPDDPWKGISTVAGRSRLRSRTRMAARPRSSST